MPMKSEPRTCSGNGVVVTLKIVKPWWWSAAVWVAALPILAGWAITGMAPTEEEQSAFADRWAKRFARHAKVVAS